MNASQLWDVAPHPCGSRSAPPSHARVKSTDRPADVARVNPPRARLLRAAVVAVCALTASATAAPQAAQAAAMVRQNPNGASTARAQARQAAAQVLAIQARLRIAQVQYASATRQVGQQVSTSVLADTARVDAERAAEQAADRTAASARALYASGGQAGLLSSMLTSHSLNDLAIRMSSVRRLLNTADASADQATVLADQATRLADAQSAKADAAVVTAAQLTEQAAQVEQLLGQAQQSLDALSAQARRLTEAEAAARALARARAAAAAAQVAAVASVRAQVPPADFFALYRSAATTCPGMDWTLLAAVGQVESGHGRNVGPSSAGAIGAMQFMPATFAMFAVDGDRDGRFDAYSSADSVYTAAHYLCTGGAGTPSRVPTALFRYNHAQWYVDLVLSVQAQLRSQPIS